MSVPRGLTPEEAALWRKVTASVTPLTGKAHQREPEQTKGAEAASPAAPARKQPPSRQNPVAAARETPQPRSLTRHGLDGTWERRLAKAQVAPELTIDLHGLTLDQAHVRLMDGIGQALAMGVRVLLLVAGKPRPQAAHDLRGQRRGAIRAKLLDWLAAGPHASRIAAVRPAHPRHGGEGAVYIVLRRAG